MTIFQELQAAGLPVITADELGNITMGVMRLEQCTLYAEIVMQYFNPAAYQALLDDRISRQQLKDQYQATLDRLQQIQNAGAIPFTQAGFNQVVQAIKDEALYQERVMKFLKSMLT